MKISRIGIAAMMGIAIQSASVHGSSLINELIAKESDRRINKSPLSAENEGKVRAIAQEMGITEKFSIHGGELGNEMTSPACAGNRIYFSDKFFNKYRDNPEVIRFVIGHELGHLESHHSAKMLFGVVVPGFLAGCLAAKYLAKTSGGELFNRCLSNTIFFAPQIVRNIIGVAATQVLLYPIVRTRFHAQVHQYELEADSFSLERPSNGFSKEDLAVGAAEVFKNHRVFINIRGLKWLEKYFLVHPDSRERLRKLSFPERLSREAGENLFKLLCHGFVLSQCCSHKEGNAFSMHKGGIGLEYGEHQETVRKNFWFCSIYPHVAEEFSIRLVEFKNDLINLGHMLENANQLSDLDESCLDMFEPNDRDRLKRTLFDDSGNKGWIAVAFHQKESAPE